jgi:hypothetical protein
MFLTMMRINCLFQRAVATIQAHDSRIAAMSFNSLSNRIATASEKVEEFMRKQFLIFAFG